MLAELNGHGGWGLSDRKGRESPSSPQIVEDGLGGSKRALLLFMTGYNSEKNDSTQRRFPATSGERIVVELDVKPSSAERCLAVAVRQGGKAAAYVRFNGKKQLWCQHYDDTDTYRDIAPYRVGEENRLRIEINTVTGKMKAWVNGVGGQEWPFRAPVSSVDRIDLFMSHGNGPEVWSIVDDISVRNDDGELVFSEDFEDLPAGIATLRESSLSEDESRGEGSYATGAVVEVGVLQLVLSVLAGAAVGVFYFGGLYLTVRRVLSSPRPHLLTLGSFVVRSGIAVTVVFLIGRTHWQLLVACMVGFLLARMALLRKLGRALTKKEPD